MVPLDSFRRQKDDFFRSDESPMTEEQRRSFTGLHYFPENPDLHFRATLDTTVDRSPLMLQTSTGEQRQYRRAGVIHFTVQGQSAQLTVFENQHGYFLPFRDGTCATESYGAGRYLEPGLGSAGRLEVDFNFAYNPYCAYNERYSCPIPPKENWLIARIEAGERRYHDPEVLASKTAHLL